MKVRNKIILVFSTILIIAKVKNYANHPSYEIVFHENSVSSSFATLGDRDIYIGKKNEIESLQNRVSEKDILVVDYRDLKDADMMIIDSYRINDEKTRQEILRCLLEYEALYPSNWNRSLKSMALEWRIHNLSYFMNFREEQAKHVDLNNADEEIYNPRIITEKVLNKIIR